MAPPKKSKILHSAEFLALVRRRKIVAFLLSFLMIGAYFAFVLILALKKEILSDYMIGNIPIGLHVGISLILLAWVLTGIYVAWANHSYDPAAEKLKNALLKKGNS